MKSAKFRFKSNFIMILELNILVEGTSITSFEMDFCTTNKRKYNIILIC